MTKTQDYPDFLTATRAFYDTVAEDYAEHFANPLADKPLERALLAAFAEQVGPGAAVADLGCGPGAVTGHLAALGVDAFGLDLSAAMLAVARREHPGLRFEQGSMLDLPLPDGGLAGAVCWYSTIHTPDERLPELFAELYRVLAPGGRLLLAFQTGTEPRRLENPWGHPVTLDFRRRRPEDMVRLLAGAGFTLAFRTVREPDDTLGKGVAPAAQAFLGVVKPL
ncbi:methyltransferase domain-containing protein [Streptomyces sp. SID4946]|uniref:class I SAM-dependent methyltransferase n=1 Tax=Streptomyces sp. LamerLS-31b TaxID=1839765 RepID=UPI00081E6922|nr:MULTISPECIES: class I SAM-dependent methyltransferase [unclassified Streptomyces]MYQ94665.1 methyltransferase domain-containing protein [Streptomyces sp. SID4946]SCF72241.1 Methyltransferase domain-containing protein [Streptomyces sp. LamerLS-31b]SCF90434.1 Methyltransferase domain-containing protein [Streptomyces sp. DconLS]